MKEITKQKSTILIVVLSFFIHLAFAQTGNFNTATGVHALSINDVGFHNTANGYDALRDNTSGYQNVACGSNTLMFNTSGWSNTAIGVSALRLNTTGRSNVAVGTSALTDNTSGRQNVAIGSSALFHNTEGGQNVSIGSGSLRDNTVGSSNVAVGYLSLLQNTTGINNIAIGRSALSSNATGRSNVAVGSNALQVLTGSETTAIGDKALTRCTTGSSNTALGTNSLVFNSTGSQNTAVGKGALTHNETGNQNTALGQATGPLNGVVDLDNTTSIGFGTIVTASNQVRVGNSNVTSIGGQVAWTTLSDGRFKSNVKTVETGLDFINKLRPVSYVIDRDKLNSFLGIDNDDQKRSSNKMNTKSELTSGFIAQEVEKALEESGQPYSIVDAPKNGKDYYGLRYSEFVVPLVKSVQELSLQIENQNAIIEQQQMQIDALANNNLLNTTSPKVQSNTAKSDIILYQNQPNPYREETEIKVQLPQDAVDVKILLLDLQGKQIQSIPIQERGLASVLISGNSLSAGMYIYTLIVDGELMDSKQMVLVE